mgnify:CR=1 FL=1
MEISDLIKSARIEKGLTQQQLADVVFVTRQTISKWELGKSVPDQASLILLYQYLDIKDNEKKQLSKLIFNKQNIILILIVILFSPMVIGVRFICCKIDKIENRKIKCGNQGYWLCCILIVSSIFKRKCGVFVNWYIFSDVFVISILFEWIGN